MTERTKRFGSDFAKVDAHIIQPKEYEEAPEWTAEDFTRADLYEGGKLIRRGRPPMERPKEAVKLRLSGDMLDHFRAGGPGWQTRINATLERAVARARKAAQR
ncbi:MAG: BrnA antitoxin family protein [Bauldia sp.]